MPIRNRLKPGDYLAACDHTGFIHYASEMRQEWTGNWVHKSKWEPRNPQDFVRAKNDPHAVDMVRAAALVDTPRNVIDVLIGDTGVQAPYGPAAHLYDPGVGEFVVGKTLVVK